MKNIGTVDFHFDHLKAQSWLKAITNCFWRSRDPEEHYILPDDEVKEEGEVDHKNRVNPSKGLLN